MVQLWVSCIAGKYRWGLDITLVCIRSAARTRGSCLDQNSIDLSAYAGEASCQIRFFATRGAGFYSDIALDDIVVSDLVVLLPVILSLSI